jgi:hypothetical protein
LEGRREAVSEDIVEELCNEQSLKQDEADLCARAIDAIEDLRREVETLRAAKERELEEARRDWWQHAGGGLYWIEPGVGMQKIGECRPTAAEAKVLTALAPHLDEIADLIVLCRSNNLSAGDIACAIVGMLSTAASQEEAL